MQVKSTFAAQVCLASLVGLYCARFSACRKDQQLAKAFLGKRSQNSSRNSCAGLWGMPHEQAEGRQAGLAPHPTRHLG